VARPIRYAISGLGHRCSTTYLPALADAAQRGTGELVAVVDVNRDRLAETRARWHRPVAAYSADGFARMLVDEVPDWVILATPDCEHHSQILTALALGVSVISEKPMVISASQAKDILAAEARGEGRLKVAHNFRFLNLNRHVKEMLQNADLGRPMLVEFAYHLTLGHAGSYFRRWHRHRAASGGLAVTKSSHHFDLLSWWLDDTPVEVTGSTARQRFLPGAPFSDDPHAAVPLDADIEDMIAAEIRYQRGTRVSYTLTSGSAWEGYSLRLHGTEGSLDVIYDKLSSSDYVLTLRRARGQAQDIRVHREEGRHSGADPRMTEALFGTTDVASEAFAPLASAREGALAVAIGEAIYHSNARSAPVLLTELLPTSLATPLSDRCGVDKPAADGERS
jgi:predicted dehydrogenase